MRLDTLAAFMPTQHPPDTYLKVAALKVDLFPILHDGKERSPESINVNGIYQHLIITSRIWAYDSFRLFHLMCLDPCKRQKVGVHEALSIQDLQKHEVIALAFVIDRKQVIYDDGPVLI